MTLFLNKVISGIIQIVIFAFIPFIWWLISGRKQQNFWQWIGIKKIEGNKKKIFMSVIGISVVFMLFGAGTLYLLRDIEMATSEFAGLGISALPAILVYAIFNTAFSEELFFRGFLLKRIANKFGFVWGNCVQAILFALLHGCMFLSYVGVVKTILIVIFTGAIAYCMGYVNEKTANGSMIPSWIIHSLANIFSGICAAFLIFS